jgi:hypothetical protein
MRTAFVTSTLLIAGLSACGQSPDDRMANVIAGSAAALDDAGDSVVLGSGDEAMTISSGERARLPANFPADVFMPDEYTIESALDSAGFSMVSLRTGGDVVALAERASREMQAEGWTRSMMAGDEQSRILTFQNRRNVAALSFDRADDGVVYSVQLSPARN